MEAQQQVEVTNPYWDEVAAYVEESRWEWNRGHYEIGNPLNKNDDGSWKAAPMGLEQRFKLSATYSWTIPDPGTLLFVQAFADRMVDPMAGTGYWAYLLGQLGVDVVCYDRAPQSNHWHEGEALHVPVLKMEGEEAVKLHPDRALLLSWPPYNQPDGLKILEAYEGDRVIYIGEPEGGCCGCERLHEALDSEWNIVATHRPVQWFGIHDVVVVYDRRK